LDFWALSCDGRPENHTHFSRIVNSERDADCKKKRRGERQRRTPAAENHQDALLRGSARRRSNGVIDGWGWLRGLLFDGVTITAR
jgi:hypothetical protein